MDINRIYTDGSFSRFSEVSYQSSGFAEDDVVNMKEGGAEKAGTFHRHNIFRRAFRSADEVRENNDTRQKFLDSLKETFGLTENGMALVERLAGILGRDVFKPEDYSFGEDGRIDCGRPLTARRVTAVSEKISVLRSRLVSLNNRQVDGAVMNLCNRLSYLYTLLDAGKIVPKVTDPEMNDIYNTISSILSDPDERNERKNPYVGFESVLRVAVSMLSRPAEEKDKIFNAIRDGMELDARFAAAHAKHEQLINEHFAFLGIERPENDGLGGDTKSMTAEIALNILNLPSDATMRDVRRAYKILVARNHPDKLSGLPEDQRRERTDLYTRIVSARDFLQSEFEKGLFDKEHRVSTEPEPEVSQRRSDPTPLFIGDGNLAAERDFLARGS